MIDNPIKRIQMKEYSNSFKNLSHLNISGTLMDQWEDLESLNCLTKLESVKLKGIPLLKVIYVVYK